MLKKCCFILLLLSMEYVASAQDYPEPPLTPDVQKKINNLKDKLRTAGNDSSRVLLLYEITTWYAVSFSQKAKLQSGIELYNAATKINFPRGMCLALYYRCSYYNVKDSIEKIKDCANQLLTLSEKLDFAQGKGMGYFSLALYYGRKGDFEKVYQYSLNAITLFEKTDDRTNYIQASSFAAAACYRLGRYREALSYYYTAVNGWKELGGRQYEGAVCRKMSDIFLLMGGNETLALEYCRRSQDVMASISYWPNVLEMQLMLGDIFLKMKNNTAALAALNKAENMNNDPEFWKKVKEFSGWKEEKVNSVKGDYQAGILQLAGKYYFETGRYDKAMNSFKEALRYFTRSKDSATETPAIYSQIASVYYELAAEYAAKGDRTKADSNYNLALENNLNAVKGLTSNLIKKFPGDALLQVADILNMQGKRAAARSYLNEGLKASLSFNARPAIARAYLLLSKQDSAAGNFSEAYKNYKLYQAYLDSIATDENIKKTEAAAIREDFRKRAEVLELTAAENKNRITRQKQKRNFAYLFSGLVLAGTGYGVYRYRRVNKQKAEQRRLKERLSISQDLHDQVGSTLSSIAVYSKVAQVESEKGNAEKMNELLDRIRNTSGKIMTEMNDIVWAIHPQNDTMQKIIQRMESFANPLLNARNIRFRFFYDKHVLSLNLEMEQRKNFFLIFKEAVNNAIKYSGASVVEAEITYKPGMLELTVKDHGVGFSLEKEYLNKESLSGNGLKNMYARARDMNANIRIDSAPGKGTLIKLVLPV